MKTFSIYFCARLLACAALLVVWNPDASGSDPSETTATLADFKDWPGNTGPYVRVGIRYPGMYRITGKQMEDAGVPLDSILPAKIGLTLEGTSIPVHVKASGSPLGPDDYVEFWADYPYSDFPKYKLYNTLNVYFLTFNNPDPLQYEFIETSSTEANTSASVFMDDRVIERDVIRRRSPVPIEQSDGFYWSITNTGGNFIWLELGFPGFDKESNHPATAIFKMFGMTDLPAVRPSHQFGLKLGETSLGEFSFNGIQYYDFETSVPEPTERYQRLSLITPETRKGLVDAIALDNITLRYPRRSDAMNRELFRFTNKPVPGRSLDGGMIVTQTTDTAEIFSIEEARVYKPAETSATVVALPASDVPTTYVLAADYAKYTADEILYVAKASPAEVTSTTEAIILYHPRVAKAADLLAKYRASHGRYVQTVDVTTVFDAMNHGFISDAILKQFLRYAKEQSPDLRYLVLLGDATADYRQTNYGNLSRPAAWNLIPIHWVANPAVSYSGGYPDDNWYGSFANPNVPDLAVGRIPANNEDEGIEYVRKIIEHEQFKRAADGDFLLVSSVEKNFQELVLDAQKSIGDKFTSSTVLFPTTHTVGLEVNHMINAINKGVNLLYYVGHGGSYVWRVGPSDFNRQKDLFTPKDLPLLDNLGNYPVITCSSCFTTSFDNDLSLGESLMLAKGKGAIALIGTPWKSTVYEDHAFNQEFLREYVDKSNARLGDAFLKAKRSAKFSSSIVNFQSFILLGDPMLKKNLR